MSQFGSPGFDTALRARTNRKRSAPVCQGFGDGFTDLPLMAHACDHRDFTFKASRHVGHLQLPLIILSRHMAALLQPIEKKPPYPHTLLPLHSIATGSLALVETHQHLAGWLL